MGTLIKSSQFSKKMLENANIPVVLCSFSPKLEKMLVEAGFQELSLNKILAEILVDKDPAVRPQFVADEVLKIVSSIQGPIFLTDYEMLFDPRYSINVVRLFYEVSRRVKIVIKWPGRLEHDHLVYATPDYCDFHSFNIRNYDVICVI